MDQYPPSPLAVCDWYLTDIQEKKGNALSQAVVAARVGKKRGPHRPLSNYRPLRV